MQLISELWAELVATCFNGHVSYHHLNNRGMWEFYIWKDGIVVYRSQGLKHV